MYGLIYNPVAGGGKGEKLAQQARAVLEARGIKPRLYATTGVGDPAVKVEQALVDGCEALVCLGGDGTLSEVVEAAVKGQIPLYIVPGGTGNDFARVLHLPKDPMEALVSQLDGTPVQTDCGRINGRCFINIAGSGFDVKVLEKTEELKAIYPGEKAYRKALVSVLKNYSPMEAAISIDGGPFENQFLTIVEVANGQYFGGGMRVAPEADLYDGAFDVILIPRLPKFSLIFLLPLFLFAWHVRLGIARQVRARQVTVRSKGMTVNIDGRLEKMDEAVFEIAPGALCLMRPRAGADKDAK
ncbi:MAG: diacylglycerol kinase family lipid kinase [Clostridia bacterium]|nr:diacylglycerol kinase family lipid kinase [Clostridia bacterium]